MAREPGDDSDQAIKSGEELFPENEPLDFVITSTDDEEDLTWEWDGRDWQPRF
jgi:hypothetical protein